MYSTRVQKVCTACPSRQSFFILPLTVGWSSSGSSSTTQQSVLPLSQSCYTLCVLPVFAGSRIPPLLVFPQRCRSVLCTCLVPPSLSQILPLVCETVLRWVWAVASLTCRKPSQICPSCQLTSIRHTPDVIVMFLAFSAHLCWFICSSNTVPLTPS